VKRQTQVILYYLLPIAFWLLAIGGCIVPALIPELSELLTPNYYWGFMVAALVLIMIAVIGKIKRHTNSIEECFQVAVLLGIASYWLPTVVFLTLPVWAYLIYQNLFSLRAFIATLIGYALVAVWAALAVYMNWIANPWGAFFAKEYALGWIPLGAILLAWIASAIARRNLYVR